MNDRTFFPALYFPDFAGVVREYGIDPVAWFQDYGIAVPADSEGVIELTLPTFCAMIEEIQTRTDPATFGLQVGQRLLINSHGMLGFAALNSTSWRQLTQLLEQFLLLRTDLLTITHEIVGDEYRVVCHWDERLASIRAYCLEVTLMALKNLYDFTSMGEHPVTYTAYPDSRPVNAKQVEHYLNCRVRFDTDWGGIAVPLKSVDKPLKLGSAGGFAAATKRCLNELEARRDPADLTDRLRHLLLNSVGNFPSLETAASLLKFTPRTLHRRLQADGTSYKALLEETRILLAKRYLDSTPMTVQEIGYLLGYSESTNFRRAFKRAVGTSPKAYRMAAQEAAVQTAATDH